MSIEVKNLLKQYGEQKAVNNISFKVDKGEIVGFLGPEWRRQINHDEDHYRLSTTNRW